MVGSAKLLLLDRERDFDRIQAIWVALEKGLAPSYFLSWGWIQHWLRSLPFNVSMRVGVIERNGCPVACFCLGNFKQIRKLLFPVNGLYLNTTGDESYDCLCIEYNAVVGDVGGTLSDWLSLLAPDWDELVLPGLDARTFPGNQLELALKGYAVKIDKDIPSPYVDLQAVRDANGDYASLLGSNTRAQIRRACKGYGARGTISLEVPTNPDQALEILNELIVLHRAAWQARGKPGAFEPEFFSRFHRELIRDRFGHGEIQLLRVLVGKESIGCLYNFVYGSTVFFYQSGFRYESDERLKPGFVCHFEAIRHNATLGHSVYDFLGGASRYKASLATHHNRLIWARIQKPRLKFQIESRLRLIKRKLSAQFSHQQPV